MPAEMALFAASLSLAGTVGVGVLDAVVLVESALVSEMVGVTDRVEDVVEVVLDLSSPSRVRLKYRDEADGPVSPVTKIWKKNTAPFVRLF